MEKQYYKSLYGDNPTDYNGQNVLCLLCEKEVEHDEEHCEEHEGCYYCGERENCIDDGINCKAEHPDEIAIKEIDNTIVEILEELAVSIEDEEEVYSCCGDDMTGKDIQICPTCKEHQ